MSPSMPAFKKQFDPQGWIISPEIPLKISIEKIVLNFSIILTQPPKFSRTSVKSASWTNPTQEERSPCTILKRPNVGVQAMKTQELRKHNADDAYPSEVRIPGNGRQ